jgi:hypothetical protein
MNKQQGYGHIVKRSINIPSHRCKFCGEVKNLLNSGLCEDCDKSLYGD